MRTINNTSGTVLVIACLGLFVVLMLTAGFALSLVSELGNAQRFQNRTAAFWLAQAGISRYLYDQKLLKEETEREISLLGGSVRLNRDDSMAERRVISSTGIFKGSSRTIQLVFAARHPEVFENVLSTKGNLVIDGRRTVLALNDRIRLSGQMVNKSVFTTVFTEDAREGMNAGRVSLTYPDKNDNGRSDEFEDFVAYNRELIARYPEEEVAYIKGNRTLVLTPTTALAGKKIIYVEGEEGQGDIVIQFGGWWADQPETTVISTGNVTFNQGGLMDNDSWLNIIAWSGYQETAVLPSMHQGLILTKGIARFDDIHDTSITNGCVIADGGISVGEVWSAKSFRFKNVIRDGRLPPGLEGLTGSRSTGYMAYPNEWKEI